MKKTLCILVCVLTCIFAAPIFAGQVGYTYDALGRLDSVTYDDGTVVQYSYDSAGNRTSRIVESADFAINNVTEEEGNNLTFTVTRSGPISTTHSVDYATEDRTATAGSDYAATSGTLTFTSGQTSKTISITGIEDTVLETNETFYVRLTAPTGGSSIVDGWGLGTIVNDDDAADFAINNAIAEEGNILTFTVTRSGTTSMTHSVDYATQDQTAEAGSDYVAKSGTLTFTSGQTSKTISISSIEDSVPEANETLYVRLTSPTGGSSIVDGWGLGTITNDDSSNSPPNAQNDSVTISGVYVDRTVFVLNNDSDPDGDTLTISSVSQPSNAQVTISGGGTRLQILSTSSGTSNFSYTVSDGNGGTDSAFVTVTVSGGGGGGWEN